MSAKAELYELVECLDERRAADALVLLRRLVDDGVEQDSAGARPLARRMGPLIVSGRDFMAQRPRTWQELAAEQGVRPVTKFEDLLGDADLGDESVDEMVATIRQWRREGGYA